MGPCLVLFFEALLALSVVALLTPFVTTSCTYCGKKSKKEKRMGKALPDVTRRSVQPVHEGKLEELAKTEKTQEETEATQENSMPLSPIIESKDRSKRSNMSASTAEAQKSPKAAKTKKAVDHPAYSEMIKSAITALNEKKGSSRQAIVKYIREHYSVGSDAKNINLHVVKALKKTTENGTLKQVSGTGGSGSFKLPKTLKAPKKSTPTEPRKALSSEKKQSTSAKSPKKTSVKKKTPTSTSKSAGKPYKKAATAKPKKTVSSEKKQSTSAKTPKKTAVKKKTPTSMSKAAGKPPKKAATAVPKI